MNKVRIILDLQPCQSPESGRRGIGRYSMSLAKAILENPRNHDVVVALNAAMPEGMEHVRAQLDGLVTSKQLLIWHGLNGCSRIHPDHASRSQASEILREDAFCKHSADIIHTASLFEGWADDIVTSACTNMPSSPTAATLYDLIPLTNEKVYLSDPRYRSWYSEKLGHLKSTDLLLGISEFTCTEAKELLKLPSDRLINISAASDAKFRVIDNAESSRCKLNRRYGMSRDFVLYAGGFDRRKNLKALLAAYARLPGRIRGSIQLLVVGPAPKALRVELEKEARRLGLVPEEIVFAGYVPDDDLVLLYNLCKLYVFPSTHEGFGLPALEAMACGAAVVGSNTTSLPEVIGDSSALFDPRSVRSIADKMTEVLMDSDLQQHLRKHGQEQHRRFTWAESARRALDAFESHMERMKAEKKGTQSKATVTRNHPFTVELTNDPSCAKSVTDAIGRRVNFRVAQDNLGSVWSTLAKLPSGEALLVTMALEAGGYENLRILDESGFNEENLARCIPPYALRAIPGWSVDHVDTEPGASTPIEHVIDILLQQDKASGLDERAWDQIASSLAANRPPIPREPQFLVDISNLVLHDAHTGIQRVVKSILAELIRNAPSGYRVMPVALGEDGVFRYAHTYGKKKFFPSLAMPSDDIVAFHAGDRYLGLDLGAHLVPIHIESFRRMRTSGVRQDFVVYDLLPVLRPDCFDPNGVNLFRKWYEAVAEVADGIVCISRAVADEFEHWLHQARPGRKLPLDIGFFHLGADLKPMDGAVRVDEQTQRQLQAISDRPTFLMVGTIEPRKGHAQALTAFEKLWEAEIDVNLMVIGKPGWLVEPLIERLRTHSERGSRLFWFESASDAVLIEAYRRSVALLMASEGEGFGLPLIEAAHHGLPLIVRDLPVFREIAGSCAHYFSGFDAEVLSKSLISWLELNDRGLAPQSNTMCWLTWEESAKQLVDILLHDDWVHTWRAGPLRRYPVYDYRLHTQVGELRRGEMLTRGEAGLLLYGPYAPVPAGLYRIRIHGRWRNSSGKGWVDVSSDRGVVIHKHQNLVPGQSDGLVVASMDVALQHDVKDLEIRVGVGEFVDLAISEVTVLPLESRDSAGSDQEALTAERD